MIVILILLLGAFSAESKICKSGQVCVKEFLCVNGVVDNSGGTIINVRSGNCDATHICCNERQPTTAPIKYECGQQNAYGAGRDFSQSGKNEAKYGEFPWMVAILRVKNPTDPDGVYRAGGSLLTPQVVLTTAIHVHKVPPNQLLVRAGAWDSQNNNQHYPEQDRSVKKIITHERFNDTNQFNSIALLFVQEAFDLSPVVKTVCLPPSGAVFDYEECFSTGWGKTTFKRRTYANILKKVKLQIIPHMDCQEDLRKTQLSAYFELNESFLCAGGEKGEDMCIGDGGSPLVCPMNNAPTRFYQVGIVSWGILCGLPNVPGVYANVPYLRSWIDAKLSAENVNPTFFTP